MGEYSRIIDCQVTNGEAGTERLVRMLDKKIDYLFRVATRQVDITVPIS